MTAPELSCPPDMARDVECIFAEGEYDLPVDFDKPPRIVDLGANVGAFARWALTRWPGATVTAYEPFPKALRYLRKNAQGHAITIVAKAVRSSDHAGKGTIYEGMNNLGQTGMVELARPSHQTEGVEVDVMAAASLPECDVLKIDTEGCELEILREVMRECVMPPVIMLEYHRKEDRRRIEDLLVAQGYTLFSGLIRTPWLGTLRFVRGEAP